MSSRIIRSVQLESIISLSSKVYKVVRTCLPIIRPGKDHLGRHCEGSKKKGKTKEAVGGTTSESGHDWTFQSHRGLWKTDRDGGSWLRDYRWCPKDPLGQGTDRSMFVFDCLYVSVGYQHLSAFDLRCLSVETTETFSRHVSDTGA